MKTKFLIGILCCSQCSSRKLHIHSFIHSGHFYSTPSSPLLLRGAPDYSTDIVSEFHAEAHRQLQVKDLLAQGPYVAARTGVEPTTLRLKVIVSTKAPPRLMSCIRASSEASGLMRPEYPSEWRKTVHELYTIIDNPENGDISIIILCRFVAAL